MPLLQTLQTHVVLGRYSIEKLCLLHDYEQHCSAWRVALVLLLATPLPVLCVTLAMDATPLSDPTLGLDHNGVLLLRSIVSHALMTFALLLTVKRAAQLPDDGYSLATVAVIAVLVGVTQELVWVPCMLLWKFPVPSRELLGLAPYVVLVVLFHWQLAQRVIQSHAAKLAILLPLLVAQLVGFFAFMALAIVFANLSLADQVGVLLGFPVAKVAYKQMLWRLARSLDDLTTDVTICMVEITGGAFHAVCLQHVSSPVLIVVVVLGDLLQAVVETHLYMAPNNNDDDVAATTTPCSVQTAILIVEAALLPPPSTVDGREGDAKVFAVAAAGPPATEISRARPAAHRFQSWFAKRSSKVSANGAAPVRKVALPRSRALRASLEAAALSVQLPLPLQAQLLDMAALAPPPRRRQVDGTPDSASPPAMPFGGSVQIDGLPIAQRDEARVLEQSLRLLFASEVLLMAEFVELLLPLMYAIYVGVAWHLPDAPYNRILQRLTKPQMLQSVASSLAYAALESVSLALLCQRLQRKHGMRPWYQLAFVVERYWRTLQGKLLSVGILVVNLATVHHGVDFSVLGVQPT